MKTGGNKIMSKFDFEKYCEEVSKRREVLLKAARQVAEILLSEQDVINVELFGSLTREGIYPGDIDLLVGCRPWGGDISISVCSLWPIAKKETKELRDDYDDYVEIAEVLTDYFVSFFPLDKQAEIHKALTDTSQGYERRIRVHIIPVVWDEIGLKQAKEIMPDKHFFSNISAEIMFYDKAKCEFERQGRADFGDYTVMLI